MLPASGILDIIIIIFFFPALLLALYVGLKHGFQKSAGWFGLNLLCLFRLTGSSLGLAAIYQPGNSGVVAASLIISNIGTITLLGALLGLIGRVNESLHERAVQPRIAKLAQLITIAASVLAIIGGKDAFDSDPSTRDYGHTLTKAAIILLVVIFAIAAGICIYVFSVRHHVPASEIRLLHVCLLALPFIVVRLVLALCGAFLYTQAIFSMLSTSSGAVAVRAIMGVLMEFIVVALFLWAGCTVNRSAHREAERAQKYASNGVYQGEQGAVHGTFNVEAKHNQHV